MDCGTSVLWLGFEPMFPALDVQSPNTGLPAQRMGRNFLTSFYPFHEILKVTENAALMAPEEEG